jgi:hypothetical protein
MDCILSIRTDEILNLLEVINIYFFRLEFFVILKILENYKENGLIKNKLE